MSFRRSVLDDLDQVDVETDDSNCGEGKVYNADEQTCVDCGPGLDTRFICQYVFEQKGDK